MKLKRITITQEAIDEFAPGDPTNNPVVIALKEQCFPDATEIVVHGDEIFVDGMLIKPTVSTVRWMNAFHAGRRVVPCLLGYYES
jgi:hypothetical protein